MQANSFTETQIRLQLVGLYEDAVLELLIPEHRARLREGHSLRQTAETALLQLSSRTSKPADGCAGWPGMRRPS